MTRPRGGQIWRNRETNRTILVESRRTINPMRPVRPHSDMRWSLVTWVDDDCGRCGGISHESDFVRNHEFVRQA